MVLVYRGAKHHHTSLVLKHFGSLSSAISRMVSMFNGGNGLCVGEDGKYLYMPNPSVAPRLTNYADMLDEFCLVMRSVSIREYKFDTIRSLKLIDEWMDDPIGSGGMAIFNRETMRVDELQSLWSIFKPFDGPIFPDKLNLKYSRKDIKSIISNLKKDTIGSVEYRARRQRSSYVGENFHNTKYQEAVWIDLTLKLRDWCLQNKYSSLCYENHQEGNGENSFVALTDDVVSPTGKIFLFDELLYRKLVAPILPSIINSNFSQLRNAEVMIDEIIWAGEDPTAFWR